MNVPGCLVLTILSCFDSVRGGQPIITIPSPGYFTTPEEIPIGTLLFTFNAYDPDPNHDISVFTSNAMANTYVSLTITGPGYNRTVEVKTKHRLDKEAHSTKLTLEFTADDGYLVTDTKSVDVYLDDINDNPPVLLRQTYRWDVPELPWNCSAVFKEIYGTDADKNDYGLIEYSFEPLSQSEAVKEEHIKTFSIDKTTGDVKLLKAVEYSNNNFYHFTVFARDTPLSTAHDYIQYLDCAYENPSNVVPPGNSNFTSADLIINVIDRQNRPPFFTYRRTISAPVVNATATLIGLEVELHTYLYMHIVGFLHEPRNYSLKQAAVTRFSKKTDDIQNTEVLTVTAVDGDTGLSNLVNYTIENGPCSSFFRISQTGVITTSRTIDRASDEINSVGGVCVLKVLVQEIESSGYVQYGVTTARTDVTITITGMNSTGPICNN